jgi:hypothetical protein
MTEKGLWEKMIEEYPESEKEIKNTFGYQSEMVRKGFAELRDVFKSGYFNLEQTVERFLKNLKGGNKRP